MDILADYYLPIKALHIISFVSWMAGLLYLPRLFVYHATLPAGSESSETFKKMETKLYRFIMSPAMAATWSFGLLLVFITEAWQFPWFHAKALLLVFLTIFHMHCKKMVEVFRRDENARSHKFFRYYNEIPTLLMISIVFLAVTKPF